MEKKIEYLVVEPNIKNGKFVVGSEYKKTKNFFGRVDYYAEHEFITQQEWLNIKGNEGWELVHISINALCGDCREYVFKRVVS